MKTAGLPHRVLAILFCFAAIAISCSRDFQAIKKQAEAGDARAQFQLGVMYAMGQEVAQDYEEAYRWYRAAADQGHPEAELNLGLMYARGTGVAKDLAEATRWFQKAAAHGNEKAKFYISGMR